MAELAKLVQEGKLKYSLDVQNGLEEAPNALKRLLLGQNKGKVIVKVDKDASLKASL